MNTTTRAIGVLTVIVIILTAILYLAPATKVTSLKQYQNEKLGISFTYPANYIIEEHEAANGERAQYAIVVVDEQAQQHAPINGEGPTSMSFNFYQNNLDNLTPVEWVNNTSLSNFKLSGEKVAPLIIDGREAFTYSWDGLYRGLSGAIEHGDWILVASVTTLTPEDQIAKDFREVIKSIHLGTPAAL